MEEEMESLRKNDIWDLVGFLDGRKTNDSKWVFKRNTNAVGCVEKYKARLVSKGYSQVEGVDFGEIFSHVAKLTSIRVLMSLVIAFNLEIDKMDVKTTFLHGDLEEEIYMKYPEGFIIKGKEELVCSLKKSLYGLKQSPRMWYQKFDSYIHGIGFKISQVDHCVYIKQVGNHIIYIALYVNDIFLVGNDMDMIEEVKQ